MHFPRIAGEIVKVRPGLSGIGSIVFRDEEEMMHGHEDPNGFYDEVIMPYKGALEEWYVADNSSVLLIARHERRVVGFVTGAEGMGPIYRQLLRRWARLAGVLLPVLVSRRKLRKISEILLMGKKTQPLSELPHAELLSIAVDPALRGQGHAQMLYQGLVDHFQKRGVDRFRIVVGEPLAAAHQFYTKMGAQPLGRIEVHQGEASVLYVHRLAGGGACAQESGEAEQV
jgi:ribosomal protein S18 acetylase RimI-like enzyme